MTDYHKILTELVEHETEREWFDFKENWYEPYSIGEYISALSNAAVMHGKDFAYLVWGVEDKTHKIVGTNFNFRSNHKNEPLEHFLARQISPDNNFSFHELEIENKRVVILEIPASKNTPTSFNKNRYLRIGSSKVNLSKYPEKEIKLFELLQNNKQTIDIEKAENQDLSFEKLFVYYASKGIFLREDTFKKNLCLLTNKNEYNLLAQLLSDNSNISVRVSIFSGSTKTAPLYSVKEFGNTCILITLDKIIEYIDVINIIQADETDRIVTRKDIPLVNKDALREAIINAFVHNKWVEKIAPMLTVYNDRIEILSRGKLPDNQSLQGFYSGESIPVNQKLSDIFLQLHISERSGRGVPIIVDVYGEKAFDIRENSILVTIPFNFIDKKKEKNVTLDQRMLNTTRKKILEEIRSNPHITHEQLIIKIGLKKTAIYNNMRFLRENGYITRIGTDKNGYWHIN